MRVVVAATAAQLVIVIFAMLDERLKRHAPCPAFRATKHSAHAATNE